MAVNFPLSRMSKHEQQQAHKRPHKWNNNTAAKMRDLEFNYSGGPTRLVVTDFVNFLLKKDDDMLTTTSAPIHKPPSTKRVQQIEKLLAQAKLDQQETERLLAQSLRNMALLKK